MFINIFSHLQAGQSRALIAATCRLELVRQGTNCAFPFACHTIPEGKALLSTNKPYQQTRIMYIPFILICFVNNGTLFNWCC